MKRLFILIGILSYFFANVHATTLPYKNLDDLVAEAEGILVGTVANTESTYGFDKDIYTFVTVQQTAGIKGPLKGAKLVLRFKGGQVENDVLDIEGSPRFQAGDQVVLFIRGNGRDIVPLVGWTQGVFRIVADPANGKARVTDYEGNKLLGVSGNNLLKERRFESEAHILDQNRGIKKSVQPEAYPGTTDDGQVPDRSSESSATTRQPLTLDQFLGDIKVRLAASQGRPGHGGNLESAGLPETVTQQDAEAPPSAQDQGQGGLQGATGKPMLPQATPVKPNPNNQ